MNFNSVIFLSKLLCRARRLLERRFQSSNLVSYWLSSSITVFRICKDSELDLLNLQLLSFIGFVEMSFLTEQRKVLVKLLFTPLLFKVDMDIGSILYEYNIILLF